MFRLIAVSLFLLSSLSFAEALNIGQWRMSASGSGLFQVVVDKNKNTRFDAELSPEFGLFVYEGLEAFARLKLSGPLAVKAHSAYESDPIRYGAALGMRYFLDTGTAFYPFAGVSFGVDVLGELSSRAWIFELPVGVAIAVNESVAITFGTALRTETTYFDNIQPSLIYFPFGIFGVKALF